MEVNSMDKDPFQVSVIIPIHNKAPHLLRCFDSVLDQTFRPLEVLVVDDASTDGSKEIALESCKKYGWRFLQRETPGQGGYKARNYAVKYSVAKWIAFLDADDEWLPCHLQELMDLVVEFPEQKFFCCARSIVEEDGTERPDNLKIRYYQHNTLKIGLEKYLKLSVENRNPIQTSSVLIDREFFQLIGGFPNSQHGRGGDQDTWLRAVGESQLLWSPKIGSIYHRDSVNMVTKTVKLKWKQAFDRTIVKLLQDTTISKNGKFLLKKYWNFERKRVAKQKLKNGQIRITDIRHFFFFADPIFCSGILLASLTPVPARVKIYKLVRDFRKAFW
jgi:succinoglycan biosynthesis protein ExoO